MYSDQEYFDGFMNGNSELIQHFYSREFKKVASYVQNHGGKSDQVYDIVQEGILVLYNNIRLKKYELRIGASMSTYFIQVCKFKWLDQVKSAHHRKVSSITKEMELLKDENDSLELLNEQERQRKIVDAAMEKMDTKCRKLLRLYYWEKMKLIEIAPQLGLTSESIKNAKYRCMKKLRTLFNV